MNNRLAFLNKPTPDRKEWLLATTLISILTLFLYHDTLNSYWRFDDGLHLMFATEHSPWQYFFDPVFTRAQSSANVTPWNVFFYDLNLALFGFEPRGFYAHLLLLITSAALALYALLRRWLPMPSTVFGIIIFLTGKPTYHLTQELMCNHYLTGMFFSLISLILFTGFIHKPHSIRLFFACLFYALAMTCKEVYVPLIALLPFLPIGTFKQRIYATLPFILLVIGYALWRHAVLGAWIGGYTIRTTSLSFLEIIQQYLNIPFLLFDHHGWQLASLILLAFFSLLAFKKRLPNVFLLLITVFILYAPLLPLTLFPGINQADRYLFAPWTALSIWIAVIFQPQKQHKKQGKVEVISAITKPLCAIVIIIASVIGLQDEKQNYQSTLHKAESIYHFAIESDFSKKALVLDADANDDYWVLVSSEARRAADIAHHKMPVPILIIINKLNGLLLLNQILTDYQLDISPIKFFHYENKQMRPMNIKPLIHTALHQLTTGKDRILKVILDQQEGLLTWDFEPKDLIYSATLWQGKPSRLRYPIVSVPQSGGYPLTIKNRTQMSVVFKSPDGWVGVTPRFDLDKHQQHLEWQGKTDTVSLTHALKRLLRNIQE